MDRYMVLADVLFVDEPAEREFRGSDARPLAMGFARGLIAGNPMVVQVAVRRYDGTTNTWLDLGTRCNDLYAGAYPGAPASE